MDMDNLRFLARPPALKTVLAREIGADPRGDRLTC